MTSGTLIAKGKTKEIYDQGDGTVLVVSGDAITAGDGAKQDAFDGKGAASTRTNTNVMTLLQAHGVPTAFIEQVDERTFRALKCDMLPLECVCRRIATGSWLQRNPEDAEGKVFRVPTFELFFKDDAFRDPMVELSHIAHHGEEWGVFYAHAPVTGQPNFVLAPQHARFLDGYYDILKRRTSVVFEILEEAFLRIHIGGEKLVLVDFKVEFGLTPDGELVLADVIDNDSWRVWKGGNKEGQVDKQVFREIVGQMDPSQRQSLKQLFDEVAVATDAFRTLSLS